MLCIVRSKLVSLIALLPSAVLAASMLAGCSKTNDINAGPGGDAGKCADQACDGACVEGTCRAYCDRDYNCPGDGVCTDVDGAAVCLPPGARAYEPYEPFDLLSGCAKSGCEIPLDAPRFEGVLRECDGIFTEADVTSPDFDYEAGCATLDDNSYRIVAGRRIYELSGSGSDKSCRWWHAGAGAPDSLIRYSCSYDFLNTLATVAEHARVVERDGSTYVWTGGPNPLWSHGGSHARLYVLAAGEPVAPPSSCTFGDVHTRELRARPEDCELPTFAPLGRAVGPEFAGIWSLCDTPNADAPEDCNTTSSSPSPALREAFYIDARGYGQYSLAGDLNEARPSACNAAFRLTTKRVEDPAVGSYQRTNGYVVGSAMPFGTVGIEPIVMEEVVEVTEGPGSAPGTYIVGNDGSSYWYKRVPLPDDFVDPCDGTEPNFTW